MLVKHFKLIDFVHVTIMSAYYVPTVLFIPLLLLLVVGCWLLVVGCWLLVVGCWLLLLLLLLVVGCWLLVVVVVVVVGLLVVSAHLFITIIIMSSSQEKTT